MFWYTGSVIPEFVRLYFHDIGSIKLSTSYAKAMAATDAKA